MKRNLIWIVLLLLIAIVAYEVASIEFAFIGFMLLCMIFLIGVGLVSIFKKLSPQFVRVPILLIGICIAGVIVAIFKPYDEAIRNSGSASERLEYAYKTDQKDRMLLKSYVLGDMNERDELRLKQVKEIESQDVELKPLDKFHAAFVYHHSDNSDDYAMASKLAAAAAEAQELKDHYQVQWLRKAAYDRWMVSMGKPEKYNTQNNFSIGIK